jgi:hypothetical protein
MYVIGMVPSCDFTDTTYPEPVQGAHVIARGYSGRYCVVMYAGPEWLAKSGIVPLSYSEAVSTVLKNGDGYVEF